MASCIENVLKDLMNAKCTCMHSEASRCFKNGGCDGKCAFFDIAVKELREILYSDSEHTK